MCVKIYFERTGGFAGMRTSASLDTDNLPPNESEQLHDMCNNVDFFNLPSKLAPMIGAADLFRYKITIESKNGKHTVETTDTSMTPELENLVSFLSDNALKK